MEACTFTEATEPSPDQRLSLRSLALPTHQLQILALTLNKSPLKVCSTFDAEEQDNDSEDPDANTCGFLGTVTHHTRVCLDGSVDLIGNIVVSGYGAGVFDGVAVCRRGIDVRDRRAMVCGCISTVHDGGSGVS